jgi:hypothetical protein
VPTTIPSNQDIPLQAQLPSGTTEWPGPPTWSPSDPNQATIQLIDGSQQMRAVLHAMSAVTVTITSVSLTGSIDFDIDDMANVPPDPIPVALA